MSKNLLYILLFTFSCTPPKDQLIRLLSNSEEVTIREYWSGGIAGGGIAGAGINNYTLTKVKIHEDIYEWLLIKEEGTDYQTYRTLDNTDLETFKQFIVSAFETNDPNRKYSGGCTSNDPSAFEIKAGFSKVFLKPSLQTDSIFQRIAFY